MANGDSITTNLPFNAWCLNEQTNQCLKNKIPTWCHLLFYFTSYVLNMFRIWVWVVPVLQASACNLGTTQTQPHQISNTQWTENKTTDVVIQQHSRKLPIMDILMSETCWAHKMWNKTASDIKLVFHSSTMDQVRSSMVSHHRQLFNFNTLYYGKLKSHNRMYMSVQCTWSKSIYKKLRSNLFIFQISEKWRWHYINAGFSVW